MEITFPYFRLSGEGGQGAKWSTEIQIKCWGFRDFITRYFLFYKNYFYKNRAQIWKEKNYPRNQILSEASCESYNDARKKYEINPYTLFFYRNNTLTWFFKEFAPIHGFLEL